jgi:CheY-specific phosphatase CheX
MANPPDVRKIPQTLEQAVVKTFEVQLKAGLKTTAMAASVETLRSQKIDCLTTMSLESSKYVGSLVLAFSKETLLKIIERMLGETYPELTPENSDAAGELLNIIYSSARKGINEAGFDFGMALPATVIGGNLSLTKSHFVGTALLFECVSDLGPFLLGLSLRAKT